MTSSRSTASTSSGFGLVVAVIGALLLVPALAQAGGRKRVVVLELEGPKAEKFHEDLVKLIKKSHTVVPVDKWNGTAEDLDAAKQNEKDFKKVAKKLKVDAIITGKIDKRRDEYIIKLKLREGKTGALVGEGIDTKADGPRIDGKAQKDLKDELIDAISNVDANRAGGGGDEDEEEDEDKPAKKKGFSKKDDEEEDEDKPAKKGFSKKDDEEEDEDKPAKKKGFSKKDDEEDEDKPGKKKPVKKDDEEEDEDKPAKKGFSKKDDDTAAAMKSKKDDDEEEDPLPKSKTKPAAKVDDEEEDEDKPRKKVASKDDEDEDEDEDSGRVAKDGDEEEDEEPSAVSTLSPGERAVDAVIGLSLNARRMSFTSEPGLAMGPPPYKGVPVAGLLIDATVYPLAIGHKKKGMAKNIGATVMYDKVLKISSEANGVTLPTTQSRWAVGGVFRYPLGKATVGATLRFGRQSFNIKASGGVTPDIPNVNYTIIDPSLFARFEATPKITLGVNFGFMLLTSTGQIQNGDQYGPATVSGFEGEIGGDYLLTKNIFVRAAFKFETIGFKFRGGAMKTNMKYDADQGQDVFGARDSYLGGAATVGYLY